MEVKQTFHIQLRVFSSVFSGVRHAFNCNDTGLRLHVR